MSAQPDSLLERLKTQVGDVLKFLRSEPQNKEEAQKILKSIYAEVESLVKLGNVERAVAIDLFVAVGLHGNGYFGAAITFLNQAFTAAPRNEYVLMLLIDCHLKRSDIAKARKLLDYALNKVKPKHPYFRFLSGRALMAEARLQGDGTKRIEAAREFETALAFGVREPDHVRYWLAHCYKSLGMPEKALGETARIDRSKLPPEPGSDYTWYGFIGGLYADMMQWDKAIQYELRGLDGAATPHQRLRVYCSLAGHYNCAGDNKQAIEYAKRVISSEHSVEYLRSTAYSMLAGSYYHLGELDSCIEYAKRAIQEGTKPTIFLQSAYIDLGKCYRDRGEREKSREMFSKAIELIPNSDAAKTAKALLNEMDSEPDESKEKP